MGKLILCTGKLAKRSYRLPEGQKIYSIEELCCYVYQNFYMVERDFFGEELLDWLREECDCADAAEKLSELKANAYPVRDLIVALLCSADYYTEKEIIELIKKLATFEGMPLWKRKKLLADEYLKKGYYSRAHLEYEKILSAGTQAARKPQMSAFTQQETGQKQTAEQPFLLTDEDRGILLHNIGITRLHTNSATDAADNFLEAYRLGRRKESLKHCLFACKYGGLTDRYRKVVRELEIGPDFLHAVEEEWEAFLAEADRTAAMEMLRDIEKEKQDGYVQEAYEGLSGIVESWKKEYREGAVR